MNNRVNSMTGMKPLDAVGMKEVGLVNEKIYDEEETLPLDGLYRYLLQPGEEHGDGRKRATDRIWSKEVYKLKEVLENKENRTIYILDGVERSFVKEELMLVDDVELPPKYVLDW